MNLFLDFDGVIVNTIKAVVGLYNEDYCFYDNFEFINWFDITTWDFDELFLSKRCQYRYFNQPRFFQNLEFMEAETKEVIQTLSEKYTVKIVTIGSSPNITGKKLWLKSNLELNINNNIEFIPIDSYKFKDKSHIDMTNSIFIDDVSKNLKTSNATHKICFGEIYDWNRNWNGIRCSSWYDIKRMLL